MLLERAQGLADRITRYRNLKGMADEAEQFETRANQFSNVSERLTATHDALRRFREAGIEVAFVPADAAGLAAKAKTLRVAVQENPAVLGDPPFDLKYQFTDRLVALSSAADRAITEAWKRYVDERSDLHSEDVLNALAALPQFKAGVAKIRQCRANIAVLGASLPADPSTAVARLSVLVDEHRTAWAELRADGIPDAVVAFLRACAAEGAPLSGLTDEVRTWLESRNLLSAFRIKIR
jgi:hypothetical protein